MNEGFWYLISAAFGIAMGVMFFAWLLAKRIGNASVEEVAWSLGFGLLAVVYLMLGQGDAPRKWLVFAMVGVWSLRCSVYSWRCVARRHPEEGRYVALREQYSRHAWLMFLGLFELQGILLAILSAPFALVSSNPAAGLSVWEWTGVALWAVAMAGGLLVWRWRVFFDWFVWVAFFVFALGSPDGWIAVLCPVIVLVCLVDGTGVPGAGNDCGIVKTAKIPS